VYNLGNSAYRQGRLEEAVELYKRALELDPDDRDAKFNLEFVRDEIRRRHEEAKNRQQQQQEQSQNPSSEEQQEQQEPSEGENSPSPSPSEDADQQQAPSPGEDTTAPQDSDQDGLPDSVEEQGDNPTDPYNPDSDADGLPDGAEDQNRNGRVDPFETDPNLADSDGDGVPDGAEPDQAGANGQALPQELAELTPEEAERYLQALEEGRPIRQMPAGGPVRRSEKDW
jgi:tetratricopeptide (TPR) repeat protein